MASNTACQTGQSATAVRSIAENIEKQQAIYTQRTFRSRRASRLSRVPEASKYCVRKKESIAPARSAAVIDHVAGVVTV